MRLEDPVLFVGREPPVKRQDVEARYIRFRQRVCGIADFSFPWQENEDVARAFTPKVLDGMANCLHFVHGVFVRAVASCSQRLVPDFHRVRPPRHFDNWCPIEVVGEPLCVDSGGRDNDLEVRPRR